eukprot:570066-Pelagomonas_calceolata.AAC.6
MAAHRWLLRALSIGSPCCLGLDHSVDTRKRADHSVCVLLSSKIPDEPNMLCMCVLQVDTRKRADQEGKGGWGTKGGATKQHQAFTGNKQQQQQSLQSARGGWSGFEGSGTQELVWDAPMGLTALVGSPQNLAAPADSFVGGLAVRVQAYICLKLVSGS